MGLKRRRVGVLGGTFDPPHIGHLALARAARDALHLDEVRLIPTGHSWQKGPAPAPAAARLAMTRCAAASLDASEKIIVDDREVQRAGPSYTVDTLQSLRDELDPETALVLIMGSDQFRNLTSWHRWPALLDLAHIATTQRERISLSELPDALEACVAQRGQAFLPDTPAGAIVFFSTPPVPVSATALRAQLARGEHPEGLTPTAVLHYIHTHQLYQTAAPN
jgi:nicotinate-nucleotide adenylyltransferase